MNEALQDLYDKIQRGIIEANNKQTEEIKQQIKTEIDNIKELVREEAKKTKKLEDNFEELKQKYNNLQKSIKRNNTIIFGIEENEESLATYVVNKLNQLLQINLTTRDINDIFKIGKVKEKRPIIVKFISHLKKVEVLKNCRKLKDTGISISDDLSVEEREENKILRKHLKQAKSQKLRTFIKGNKLHVNDEVYTARELPEYDENELGAAENEKPQEIPEIEVEQSKRTNSAPATPNKNTEIESYNEEELETYKNTKKGRKITVPTYPFRNSARLQDKELKFSVKQNEGPSTKQK